MKNTISILIALAVGIVAFNSMLAADKLTDRDLASSITKTVSMYK